MKNIFLEKSYTKCGGEAISRPFSKKSKLSISLDQQSEFFFQFVLLHLQIDEHQNILKLRCLSLAFTFNKGFLKNKKTSRTSLSVSFSA